MEGENSIDDILRDLGEFNKFDDYDDHKTEILMIGRDTLQPQFNSIITEPDFSFQFVNTLEDAAELLLRNQFAIILLDFGSEMDLPSVSNLLRKNYSASRIVMIYDQTDFVQITDLFNDGSFDAIITLPESNDEILKKIIQQEAHYAIQQEVTNFVSEPPKLSKASFLLLDPSLNFGDPNLPINFVGVMIVVNTVPRYNIFFEDTLANDEVLFAAFLSSITSLGDELFQAKQSLKEINFGGISVIFRFRDDIQIAFLVENLTRHNYKNADHRIDQIMDRIFPEFDEILTASRLTHHENDRLDEIFTEFDLIDTKEVQEYNRLQEEERKREFGTQVIILLSDDPEKFESLLSYFRANSTIVSDKFHIEIMDSIEKASEMIRESNVAIVMIEERFLGTDNPHDTGLFMMESIEELDPSVQILYFSMDNELDQFEIELVNSGNVDYIHIWNDSKFKIFSSIQNGLKKSLKIKQDKTIGASSGSKDGLAVAKSMLKENLEAFDSEEKPALQGLVIAQNTTKSIDPIFSKFYEIDGEVVDFDVEMMAGLVTSLKQISAEMFSGGQQKIDELDLAGHNVFVRSNSDFLFIYFVKNITPNTSILIAKELDAVSMLFSEIIAESLGVFTAQDLQPIFSEITLKTHESLTSLLEEHEE